MSWKSDRAIDRIVKLFKRAKNQVFEEDIKAVKTISETIQENENKFITDNVLFAKLLCFLMYKNIEHFGSVKESIKHIQTNILNWKLEEHIELLRLHLNKNDFDEFLNNLGLSKEFTGEENDYDLQILKSNEKEVIKNLSKFWNYKKVEKSFYNTANEFLRDTDNYI